MFNPKQYYEANKVENIFISIWDTSKVSTGSSTNKQIKFPATGTNLQVDWGDGIKEVTSTLLHTYAISGIYTVKVLGKINNWNFGGNTDKLKLLEILNWGNLELTTPYDCFSGCQNLTLNNCQGAPKLSNNSLIRYFLNCTSLTIIKGFENWKTVGGYCDARSLFQGCSKYNDPAFAINKLNIISYGNTFNGATLFNQPLPNSSGINGMTGCFNAALNFNQDISTYMNSKDVRVDNVLSGRGNSAYNPIFLSNLYNKLASLVIGKGRIPSAIKSVNVSNAKYDSSGTTARTALIADGWSITDGGMV